MAAGRISYDLQRGRQAAVLTGFDQAMENMAGDDV
jgi:hypothetical protein